MFSHDMTAVVECPRCNSSTEYDYTMNISGSDKSYHFTKCHVCEYESGLDEYEARTDGMTPCGVTIPENEKPRIGIQLLAENADISIEKAAKLLESGGDITENI